MEFYDAHTNYEWNLQRAANIVEPFGEPRADIRAERNTMARILSQIPNVDRDVYERAIKQMTQYADGEPDDQCEIPLNEAALAKLKETR